MGNLEPAVAAALIRDTLDGRPLDVEVVSGSMSPLILPGDRVTVVGVGARAPRIGDILVYDLGFGLATHRMVGRSVFPTGEQALVLKGDANGTCDDHVLPLVLVGRVTRVLPAASGPIALTGPWFRGLSWIVGVLSGVSGRIWEYRSRRGGGLLRSVGRAALRPVGFAARRAYLAVCGLMRGRS